ncbi:MAG: hypothetical protein HYT31_04105 [Parcubacteria group bacterium]|nr:hypothetical protein [Parcubacteria group bacterium]
MRTAQKLASSHYALVAALLIAAFIVTCRGLVAGGMAAPMDHGAHQTQKQPHALCCSVEDAAGSAVLHSQFQSALPSAYLLFAALVFIFFFPLVRALVVVAPPYAGSLERRYGGTRLYSKYAELFSQGILHPKTF